MRLDRLSPWRGITWGATVRTLGFKTTTPALRATIKAQTASLIADGTLRESDGMLLIAEIRP